MPRSFAHEVAARALSQLNSPLRFAARAGARTALAAGVLLVLGPLAVRFTAATGPAPRCAPAALSVSVSTGGGAAGSVYYPLAFRDTSARPCTLYGYPGVSFLWPDGKQAGGAASRDPQVIPSAVALRPGGSARALLRVADALAWPVALCVPAPVHRLRVYPPGSHVPLVLRFSTVTCSRKVPPALGSPLSVTAVAGSLP